MTTEIKFWEAMKAVEQGKTVQYYNDEWYDFTANTSYNIIHIKAFRWRIKPEPVKYSVDVWLDRVPVPEKNVNHAGYIFGSATWMNREYDSCNKHYRITVEQVECEE